MRDEMPVWYKPDSCDGVDEIKYLLKLRYGAKNI